MENPLQKKRMADIYTLLKGDLSLIDGEEEYGPIGEKKIFLNTAKRFLDQLAKELQFTEFNVSKNPSGISCSGDVSLSGLWGEGNGVYFLISQDIENKLLYREITALKNGESGINQFIELDLFQAAEYGKLKEILLKLRKEEKKTPLPEPEIKDVLEEVTRTKENRPKEEYYVLIRLKEMEDAILTIMKNMVDIRNKLEKSLQRKKKKSAQNYYKDIEHLKNELLQTLRNIYPLFEEIEDKELSLYTLKLIKPVETFNIMLKDYTKFKNIFLDYLSKFPTANATTNEKVIGRLMNNVKIGYYPTDETHVAHIARAIEFPEGITTNLFDPCCGCGIALRHMANGNNCYTYGVEIDESRANEAITRLHRVGIGSFYYSDISHEAFHVLFLNPPYISVVGEHGRNYRSEKRFLAESIPHLMMGGVLVYIIPYYRLTEDVCQMLSSNFDNLSIWRFEKSEFKKYKQIAILGTKKKRGFVSEEKVLELLSLSFNVEQIPEIHLMENDKYPLPKENKKVENFKGQFFNLQELKNQFIKSNSFSKMFKKAELDTIHKEPPMALGIGQIALLGGSGHINGYVDCDTPHIIKGMIVKEKRTSVEEEARSNGSTATVTREVVSNKMIFNILTNDGFKSLA